MLLCLLLSFNMILRLIHIICYQYFILFIAEYCSIVWIYHDFFTHLASGLFGKLGCFQSWTILNKVTMDTPVQSLQGYVLSPGFLRTEVLGYGRYMLNYFFFYKLQFSFASIHTEETRIERDMCTPMIIAALFIISRKWKQPRCPSADEWLRKLSYIYTME